MKCKSRQEFEFIKFSYQNVYGPHIFDIEGRDTMIGINFDVFFAGFNWRSMIRLNDCGYWVAVTDHYYGSVQAISPGDVLIKTMGEIRFDSEVHVGRSSDNEFPDFLIINGSKFNAIFDVVEE